MLRTVQGNNHHVFFKIGFKRPLNVIMESTTVATESPGRSSTTIVLETATITIISLLIFLCNIGNLRILKSVTFWHKSTVNLLMNLAVSDICVAIFTTSAIYECVTSRSVPTFVCQMQAFLGGTSVTVSLITMGYISLDRYIIIAHPLRHRSFMSNKTIIKMTALSWIVSILLYIGVFCQDIVGTQPNPDSYLCSADLMTKPGFVAILIICIFLPTNVTIIFCYGSILCIAKRHSSSINLQNSKINPKKTAPKRSHKAAGMFVVVFGMFNLCWGPYIILVVCRGFFKLKADAHWINFILPWMAMSNSFVNIFIYYILNSQYRRAVKKILGCHEVTPHEGYTMDSNF